MQSVQSVSRKETIDVVAGRPPLSKAGFFLHSQLLVVVDTTSEGAELMAKVRNWPTEAH